MPQTSVNTAGKLRTEILMSSRFDHMSEKGPPQNQKAQLLSLQVFTDEEDEASETLQVRFEEVEVEQTIYCHLVTAAMMKHRSCSIRSMMEEMKRIIFSLILLLDRFNILQIKPILYHHTSVSIIYLIRVFYKSSRIMPQPKAVFITLCTNHFDSCIHLMLVHYYLLLQKHMQ